MELKIKYGNGLHDPFQKQQWFQKVEKSSWLQLTAAYLIEEFATSIFTTVLLHFIIDKPIFNEGKILSLFNKSAFFNCLKLICKLQF